MAALFSCFCSLVGPPFHYKGGEGKKERNRTEGREEERFHLYENPGDCSGGEWRGMGGEKRKGSGIGEVKGFVIIVSTEASERERGDKRFFLRPGDS